MNSKKTHNEAHERQVLTVFSQGWESTMIIYESSKMNKGSTCISQTKLLRDTHIQIMFFFCFQITHNYAIQELISCIAEYILVFIFIYGTYERK